MICGRAGRLVDKRREYIGYLAIGLYFGLLPVLTYGVGGMVGGLGLALEKGTYLLYVVLVVGILSRLLVGGMEKKS